MITCGFFIAVKLIFPGFRTASQIEQRAETVMARVTEMNSVCSTSLSPSLDSTSLKSG